MNRTVRAVVTAGVLTSCVTAVSACSSSSTSPKPQAGSTTTLAPASVDKPTAPAKILLNVHDGVGTQSYPVPATGVADIKVGYTCTGTPNAPVTVSVIQDGSGATLYKQDNTCLNTTQGFAIHLDKLTGASGLKVDVSPPAAAHVSVAVYALAVNP